MTAPEDMRPMDAYCELVQFGPITRGFKCVYLAPVCPECAEDHDDFEGPTAGDDEKFEIQVREIRAFGLAKINWDGTFVIEPVSLVLEDGDWIVANKQPGYCGTFLNDGTERDEDEEVTKLLEHLDPYFAKRVLPRGTPDGEGAR